MKNKKALVVLQKYLDGKASLEEKILIDKWYEEQEQSKSIRFEGDPELVKEKLYQKILDELNDKNKIEKEKAIVVPLYKKTIFRVAAAVIFVTFMVGAFFVFNTRQPHQLAGIQKNDILKQDIAPGGNKAVLTLSDGSTIILDSVQNGMLSQQGNSKVVKLDDGKLAYQKENSEETKIQYNTITTPRGGQYQLTLSDGSQVWLNAASSITFPTSFSGDKREVKITGEAYFEVVHNAAMPFHVLVFPPSGKLKGADVQVLGTHFNINAYKDEGVIKTTLLEGSVKVSNGSESVKISPAEQALLGPNEKIIVHKNIDLDEVTAWKNGYFNFNRLDISSIMRQVSRWYNVDIEFAGKISDDPFSGIVSRNKNVSEVLKIMQQSGIKFNIEGNLPATKGGKIIVTN